MRRRLVVTVVAPLAVLASFSTSAVPAAASATHGCFVATAGSGAALEHSSNWAGIAVTGGHYARAAGSWTVPRVKVTAGNRYAADWVGIGGYSTGDLIQSGTSEESVNGHANYYAWTEILPAPEVQLSGFAIRPGDAVTISITEASIGSWTIVVTNHSTGQTATKRLNYASTYSSAEWIHEAPTVGGTQSRLATTSTAIFDLGTVNGATPIGSAGTGHRIQLVGPTDATPSLLGGDHDGFAVADGAAVPPAPPS